MKSSFPFLNIALMASLAATGGCTNGNVESPSTPSEDPAAGSGGGDSGGKGGGAGHGGANNPGTAGAAGTAGSAGGSGGSNPAGGAAGKPDAASSPPGEIDMGAAPSDGGSAQPDGPTLPPPPSAWGGVGETPFVPLHYPEAPVPPLVEPECPDDPTEGFTEYQAAFRIQRPHNLAAADRFTYKDGIYTFWVQSNDRPHTVTSGTEPRTEARYENFSTGEHIWSADVMYESVSRTCVMQIHNVVGAIAVYFRVQGNRMFNLASGQTILNNYRGKWFNLKVAFNTETLQVRTYVNNCLKATSRSPRGPTPNWYFKHGVYTCDSGTCRSNYKNIHLYHKGATPPPPAIQR